jgi:hypothetical protein
MPFTILYFKDVDVGTRLHADLSARVTTTISVNLTNGNSDSTNGSKTIEETSASKSSANKETEDPFNEFVLAGNNLASILMHKIITYF